MSDPFLFTSPLARQAARSLHTVEWLSENNTWSSDSYYRWNFWRTRRMMARTPDEAAAWLPALAFALSREESVSVLAEFARWPLPEPLPPEALPWRTALIQGWEQYPAATDWETSCRLFALMRLDRRVERLPEWLREARRALDLEPEDRRFRLAALAGWRPRPGDSLPHGDKAEAAQAWVRFWEESYKSPYMEGLIAAAALLHLAEAGWLPSGPSPERLREEFRQRVQEGPVHERSVLQMVMASISADALSPEQQDIMAWLELTHENVSWKKREAVWDMLAAWQQERILERSGRGQLAEPSPLLPALARTLEWEWHTNVLAAMMRYIPEAAEVSTYPKAARTIVDHLETHSRNEYQDFCLTAWVARWNLLRAGALTAEEQARFNVDYADYVETIGSENELGLLALAQIIPPGTFPLAAWTGRLSDWNNRCRLTAHLAIHGWLMEVAGGGQHRQIRQVLRRRGQEGTDAGTVAPFVNIPPNVLPDFRRLHEIETALAAGQIPPPDAGAGNRPISRTVPARLPESRPRKDPPGITGRMEGPESTLLR